MKQPLEKAISSSQKGCIYDHDEIDKSFTRLLETPAVQLIGSDRNYTIQNIDSLFICWNIDPNEKMRSALTVGEFWGFAKGFQNDPSDDTPQMQAISLRCYYAFLYTIEEQLRCSKNTAVKLFRFCSLKSFYFYTLKKAGRSAGESKFEQFKECLSQTMSFSVTDTTTIGEYLDRLYKFQCTCWLPSRLISDYENQIRGSYDAFAFLILDGTEQICPDMFDVQALKEKYKSIAFEYRSERNDEQWQIS